MAYKNKHIINPVTNQEIVFLQTAADTNGALLEMESVYRGRSKEPAGHYHPHQDETFTVVEGRLDVVLEAKHLQLHAGETLHIAKGKVHAMWNATDEITRVNWKVQPAMHTENFLETAMGLAADGRTNNNGMPGLLQVSLLASHFADTFRLSNPPAWIQQVLFALLKPVARLSGLKPVYSKYID